MSTLRAIGVLACTLAALPGCGGEDSAIPDGRHFGYIRSVVPQQESIEFDPAQFLTGKAAQQAAVEDGTLAPGEPVPNDYYIRNRDSAVHTVPIIRTASVTAVRCDGGCSQGHLGALGEFLASFSRKEPPTLADDYRGSHSQYWLTVADGRVVAIDEQYLP